MHQVARIARKSLWKLSQSGARGPSVVEVVVIAGLLATAALAQSPSLGGGDYAWVPFSDGTLGWDAQDRILSNFFSGSVPAVLSTPASPPYNTAPLVVTVNPPPIFGDPDVVVTVCEQATCRDSAIGYPKDSAEILHFYNTPSDVDAVWEGGAPYGGTVSLSFFYGHQQEAYGGWVVDDLSQAECVEGGDYEVWFNGQKGQMGWCSVDSTCRSWLGSPPANLGCLGAITNHGLYFPLNYDSPATGQPEKDHYLWRTRYPFVDFAAGESAPQDFFSIWANDLPYGGTFFDPVDGSRNLFVRPLLIELVRRDAVSGDGTVVDRARLTYYDDRNDLFAWFGRLLWVPGSWAMLTPSGLDRLEAPHLETLPYPDANVLDERMSDDAKTEPWTDFGMFANDAVYELAASDTYFRDPNPDGSGVEWQGYLAYQDILDKAQEMNEDYLEAMVDCGNDAVCQAQVQLTHCVKLPPGIGDFKVIVEGIDTRFDHGLALPVTAGAASNLDLSFRNDQHIAATLDLADVHSELEGDLLPFARIAYHVTLANLCIPIIGINVPRPRHLTDFDENAVDREGWLECHGMDLHADLAQGDLAFPVRKVFETIEVDPATGDFTLQGVSADATSGNSTCAEAWLAPEVEPKLLEWEDTVADVLTASWKSVPSQEEGLKRLLSPLDLGIEQLTDPPAGTASYDVHPLDWTDLSAWIIKSLLDPDFFGTDTSDGLYAPYQTRAQPEVALSPAWKWPCLRLGMPCAAPMSHDPTLYGGTDSFGAPFDVAMDIRPEYINQLLWSQAPHAELLGQPGAPNGLDIAPDALETAAAAGFPLAEAVFASYAAGLEVEIFATVPPYVWLPDADPYRIALMLPQVVVEVRAADSSDLVARFLVDLFDLDLSLKWGGEAKHTLLAGYREDDSTMTTVHFPDRCEGVSLNELAVDASSCEGQVRGVVQSEAVPYIRDALLDMLNQIPAPKLWDQAGEATTLRSPTNRRYERIGYGIRFIADLY